MAFLLQITFVLLTLAVPAAGYQADTGAIPGAPETDAASASGAAADPARWASPRALFRHFLVQMKAARDEGDIERQSEAARVFATWSEDPSAAERLAAELYDVLNKTEHVVLEDLPGAGSREAESASWTYAAQWPEDPSRFVLLRLRQDADGWFVPSSEDAQIHEYAAAMEGVRYLPGVIGAMSPLARLHFAIREHSPEFLRSRIFLLENWQWLGLAVLLFVVVALDWLTRRLLGRIVRRLMRSESSIVPADELDNFERPVGILAAALFFEALMPVLGLDPTYARIVDVAASVVAVVAGIWASYRLVDVICAILERKARRTQNKFDDVLVPLLRRTLKILLTIVALFFLASKWTEDLWGVVAGLSIGSLAVGFAARDSIENLFGTFTVLLDKPFQLGDWITVGEIDGDVEEVGFRSTRVRTFYNSVITVPNRVFISAHVDNWGKRRYRRYKTHLALTYDTPPEKIEAFCEGVRELVRLHPYTRKDYYHVYLNQFGASSLDVLLYCFFRAPDWATELRERHRLMNDILRLAQGLGVSFAFPSQSLYMVEPEDLEHSDTPAGTDSAQELGRAIAGRVAAPVAGERPDPVRFD